MPSGQPILAEDAFGERDPGHQQHLQEQQVGGPEAEQATGGRERVAAGEILQAAVGARVMAEPPEAVR
ncbi:hypothetical protein [Paractinoplanes ovalisporus]|uniref:hypothetical protein n=1 Tax=Paractinoplanes ovalisporus TaxID=2810368 RepID=UPI001F180050|nr:hypothetical protein [Actinoplanes ovalisporus]